MASERRFPRGRRIGPLLSERRRNMAARHGRVAIVSGGARGVGAGVARCLASDGASLAILDLDGGAAAGTAMELANGSIGMACDVADEAQISEAFARVVAK